MLHIINNQEECEAVTSALYTSKKQSHIIYIYAHGSDDKDIFDVLKSMDGNYIFIDELAKAIQEAMAAGKHIYIVAHSCYWNLKYDWGFPTPTISFGPDDKSRLPFMSKTTEHRLRALPDEFDKSFFLDWLQKLQADYERHAKVWEIHDENGDLIEYNAFRIIQNMWDDKLGPPPDKPPQLIRA